MKLYIVSTFRRGTLIYENNKLVYRTNQCNYVGFENADTFDVNQFSNETAKHMCLKAKEIVSKTKYCCMSAFLDSLKFPIRQRQENVSINVDL